MGYLGSSTGSDDLMEIMTWFLPRAFSYSIGIMVLISAIYDIFYNILIELF